MKTPVNTPNRYFKLLLLAIMSLSCLLVVLTSVQDNQAASELEELQQMKENLAKTDVALKQKHYMINHHKNSALK